MNRGAVYATAFGVLTACALLAPWLLFGIANPDAIPEWYPTGVRP